MNPNCDKLVKALEYFKPPFKYGSEGQAIYDTDGNMALQVRGWGHLTGTGAHAFPYEEAAKLQDEFGQWVADAMNAAHREATEKPTDEKRAALDAAYQEDICSIVSRYGVTDIYNATEEVMQCASRYYNTLTTPPDTVGDEVENYINAELNLCKGQLKGGAWYAGYKTALHNILALIKKNGGENG